MSRTGVTTRRLLIIIPVVVGLILVGILMPARQVSIEGIGRLSFETPVTLSVGSEVAYASPDWLGTWAKRVKITVDSTDIDQDLTYFPVLIHLSSACGKGGVYDLTPVFDEVGGNSKKIAVTKADEVTQLYVEIEKWDAGAEEAWLWVSKSDWTISSATDTDIYLYYDNTQPDNTTYVGNPNSTPAENVWDSNFMMVQHLYEGSGTTVGDSTVNDNDGTIYGAVGTAESGTINTLTDYGATGIAESGTNNTLTDNDKFWALNEWTGATIEITGGTGSGQTRTVASNTATVITVSPNWATIPDATSTYSLTSISKFFWTTNEWTGETIEITGGTGSGQTRTVASNTATVITVSSDWATNPDITSRYRVTSDHEWTTSGQLDNAIDFDEVDDLIGVPDSASLDGTNDAGTFELWIWWDNADDGDHQVVMTSSNRFTTGARDGYEWASQGTAGNHFFYPWGGDDSNYNLGPNPFTNQVWQYLVVTLEDTGLRDVKIYVDNFSMTFTTTNVPTYWTTLASPDDWLWGGNPDRPDRYFDGMFDEIRVSDTVRTNAWIKASYESERDDLLDFGSEATPVVSISVSPDKDWGTVAEGQILSTLTTDFTVTNDGDVTVNIDIHGADTTCAGTPWTLSDTATPGADVYGLKFSRDSSPGWTIIPTTDVDYMDGLLALGTDDFGLQLWTPTVISDTTNQQTGVITFTAVQAP